jgi:simple sugar transport system ATP-binding protein
MMVERSPLILQAEHLSKRFGAVTALRDVSLRLHRGEVLGLVGDNGAGKSTLIKILCGFHKPDSGTYSFDGKPVHLNSPIEARALGIQTVYQDLALVNDLSVYHNMFLGRELKKRFLGFPLLDNRTMRRQTVQYLSTLGIRIPNVDNTVSMLSGGQRQSIAVARSIYSNPTVLIMDEPLAALGVRESRLVLNLVLELKKRGDISIILIAHNYAQVFEVCDRINFLSGGEIVYDSRTADTTVANLIDLVTSGYKLNTPLPEAGAASSEIHRTAPPQS